MNGLLLEVTINAGPTAGQRVRINRSPASFGRDAENPLMVDLPTVSRVHGELRFEGDRWVLANLSANGTVLNRRAVGRRPRPLEDGDQIVVGNQPILTIALRESGDEDGVVLENESVGPTPAPLPPKQGMSPRAKLWAGIFAFWAVLGLVAIFLSTADSADTPTDAGVPRLTGDQIAAAIRKPLDKYEPSPRTAAQHLDEAVARYQMINANPKNEFLAYQSYKTALSYVIGDTFIDERNDWGGKPASELFLARQYYFELQERLIDDVTRMYDDAYGKLQDGRFESARIGFEDVFRLYADPESLVYDNAQLQRDVARRRLQRRN